MGYRSDVAAAFYVSKAEHLPVLKLWLQENFPMDTFANEIRWFDRGMLFQCSHVKWYDDYEDVMAFAAAVEKYDALVHIDEPQDRVTPTFNYEFVRIGENYDDIDSTYEGLDCEFMLGITREITVELGNE